MKIFSKIAMGSAVAALSLAQPALAGTRAANSLPVVTNVERSGAPVKKSEELALGLPLVFIIGGIAAVATIVAVVATSGDDEDVSPGT